MQPDITSQFDPIAAGMIFIVSAIFIVLSVVIYWRIFAKTGNSGALSLLMFVPLVNIIMILYLAFSEWPIEREVKQLRSQGPTGSYVQY